MAEHTPSQQSGNPEEPSRAERLREKNLFEELIRIRDDQREKAKNAVWKIKGKDLPWEINRHGKMQWYMHPCIEDVALQSQFFFSQEIAPGSKSGRQQCQGNIVFYVIEGSGFTIVDGIKHPWTANDVINLPIREEGLTYQHFNTDPEKRVLMVGSEPNLIGPLGVDKGSGFEELEPCPEWLKEQGR